MFKNPGSSFYSSTQHDCGKPDRRCSSDTDTFFWGFGNFFGFNPWWRLQNTCFEYKIYEARSSTRSFHSQDSTGYSTIALSVCLDIRIGRCLKAAGGRYPPTLEGPAQHLFFVGITKPPLNCHLMSSMCCSVSGGGFSSVFSYSNFSPCA